MEYRRLKPAEPLRDIVESIWIQHDFEKPEWKMPSCVVPTGTVEVIFSYGERLAHVEGQDLGIMPRSYVTGQRSKPVQVIGTGRVGIIVVSLFPWGLGPLFPGSVEAPDGYVDLKLVCRPGRVERLEGRLSAAGNSAERVERVESFLLGQRHHDPDKRMGAASRMLSRGTPGSRIAHIARTLEMSERHLSRSFRSAIGIQPSVFMRIMRFQRAIRLRRQDCLPWADVAAACGFSDQAHLIHEIRGFAGRSPGQIEMDQKPSKSTFNGAGVSEFFDTVYL